MSIPTRDGSQAIRTAVRITENVCSLPAVATQDWCDRAAAALLPVCPPSVSMVFIGQVDEHGNIIRQEATGVAGCYIAEVTTTVGAPRAATTIVPIDPNDQGLVSVRTSISQARELSWTPGPVAPGTCRTGAPMQFGLPAMHPVLQQTPFGRRWESIRFSSMVMGIIPLGSNHTMGRCLVCEVGCTGAYPNDPATDASVLGAVLPALARRALLAIGADPSDSTHWLTTREQVILQHLLLGKSVREIAEELGRSPHTVHDHVKSLHRKLNANSRGELVARALGHVEPPKPPPTIPKVTTPFVSPA